MPLYVLVGTTTGTSQIQYRVTVQVTAQPAPSTFHIHTTFVITDLQNRSQLSCGYQLSSYVHSYQCRNATTTDHDPATLALRQLHTCAPAVHHSSCQVNWHLHSRCPRCSCLRSPHPRPTGFTGSTQQQSTTTTRPVSSKMIVKAATSRICWITMFITNRLMLAIVVEGYVQTTITRAIALAGCDVGPPTSPKCASPAQGQGAKV